MITLRGIEMDEMTFRINFLFGVNPSKFSFEQSSIRLAPLFSARSASLNDSTQTSLIKM